MKIVICVDYANSEFNKDFILSNRLLEEGHNVFLAINKSQLDYFKICCDVCIQGYSCQLDDILVSIKDYSIEKAVEYIGQIQL